MTRCVKTATADELAPGSADLDAPEWFLRAVADAPAAVDVDRGGRTVRSYTWGAASGPAVVLLHGMGANAHWWDHVAPQLCEPGRRVVAIDLAGHGDSSHRAEYLMPDWSDDVMAVCDALGIERPVLVGHSAGGRVAWTAALRQGERVGALVVIDTAIVRSTALRRPDGQGRPPRPERRVYADREEILDRFRTLPPQRLVLPYVRRHIAKQSIEAVPGGWRWKHDPGLYRRPPTPDDAATRLACPLVFLRCENGSTDPVIGALLRERLDSEVRVFELPDSGHHAMLDHPLALVAMLRVLVTELLPSRPADG